MPRRPSPFARLWSAATVSTFGTAVTTIALPLVAVLTLHASTLAVGIIAAATESAWLLIGLPAGVWVHRLPLRTTLVTADVVRAAALASVPASAAVGCLSVVQLILVGFIVSIATVVFDVGFASYLPTVVPVGRLAASNSLLQGSESVSQVAAPAVGGGLVQLVGGATTLLTDVVSYLFSALTLLTLPPAGDLDAGADHGRLVPQIREGLAYVRSHRMIARMALSSAGLNVTGIAIQTLTTLFLVRSVHVGPAWVGVLVASGGAGGLIGSAVATWLTAHVGSARAAMLSLCAAPVFALMLPLTRPGPGLALFVVGDAGLAASLVVFGIIARTYRQEVVPLAMLSRVTATVRFISWGVLPIGGLAGGLLGQAVGVRHALTIVCVLLVPAPFPFLLGGFRSDRQLPTWPDDPVHAGRGQDPRTSHPDAGTSTLPP